jgi:hypothetical protein
MMRFHALFGHIFGLFWLFFGISAGGRRLFALDAKIPDKHSTSKVNSRHEKLPVGYLKARYEKWMTCRRMAALQDIE